MKHIILCSWLLSIAAVANGQTIKIQNGISWSRLSWELNDFGNSGYDDYIVGYAGFLGVEYLRQKHFNLSTSVGYLQKKVVGEVAKWPGHPVEQVKAMKARLEKLKEQGISSLNDEE